MEQVIGIASVCRSVGGVAEQELSVWIAREWVRPGGAPEQPEFSPRDLARVRLIAELTHDLRIDEQALPVVLSLLDQLHAERARLRSLRDALRETAPPDLLALIEQSLHRA